MDGVLNSLKKSSMNAHRRLVLAIFLGLFAAPFSYTVLKEFSFDLGLVCLLILTGLSILFVIGWLAALDIEEALYVPKQVGLYATVIMIILPPLFASGIFQLLMLLDVYSSTIHLSGINLGLALGAGTSFYLWGMRARFR